MNECKNRNSDGGHCGQCEEYDKARRCPACCEKYEQAAGRLNRTVVHRNNIPFGKPEVEVSR